MAFSPIGTEHFLTFRFYPFPIWRSQATQPLTGIESPRSHGWPNASCTADHPERGFYQSHRHQTDRWFPGRPPKTGSSRPGPEEAAPGSGKAAATRGSGPPSAAGGWCKGRRWGRGWRRTRPRTAQPEPESRWRQQTRFWDLGKRNKRWQLAETPGKHLQRWRGRSYRWGDMSQKHSRTKTFFFPVFKDYGTKKRNLFCCLMLKIKKKGNWNDCICVNYWN